MVIADSCLILPQGYGKGKARIQTEQKDKPFVDLIWALFDSVGIVGAARGSKPGLRAEYLIISLPLLYLTSQNFTINGRELN